MTSAYRFAEPDDRAFIVSGWSASYRMSRNCTTPMALYAKQKHEEVNFYLDLPRTKVIVAHGAVLQGFIAFQRPLHVLYVYVAQPFRRNGVARGLFAAAGIDPAARFSYAAQTKASWELRHKTPLAEFDSYLSRFTDTPPKEHRT